MSSHPPIDPGIYETEYESLRSQMAFTEMTNQRGVGLTLLLREGLPSWINAVTEFATALLPARVTVTEHPSYRGTSPPPALTASTQKVGMIPPSQYLEAASLLASMVLSTRPGRCGLSTRVQGGFEQC